MPARTDGPAPVYRTVQNLGGADRLVSVTTPDAERVELVQHGGNPADAGRPLASVPIGAHATASLNPFEIDIFLIHPAHPDLAWRAPRWIRA